MSTLPRALFFAESVTLAHLARPLVLAQALRPQWQVALACAPAYRQFAPQAGLELLALESITPAQFRAAVDRGKRFYTAATLRRYVEDDLALIRRYQPDLIVGDFRLSLSISARLAGIPYAAISSAHWSPYYRHAGYPMPVLPLTRILGTRIGHFVYRYVSPFAMAYFCQPFNQVRREYGLPELGSDLRPFYTDAEHVFYTDIPEIYPADALPTHHHYIGPIIWEPPVDLPPWWDKLTEGEVLGYVTLGSSGDAALLPRILGVLGALQGISLVATTGAPLAGSLPPNIRVADYLPGTLAARRSRFVICNGGSLTTQQALLAGVPVIGICSNMDQFLNMEAIAACGAGIILRADEVSAAALAAAIQRVIVEPGFRQAALILRDALSRYDAPRRFAERAAGLRPASSN
jgi:UDP:flavonoid glycosyltransferase YjiC (YdhE family)